MLREKSSEVRKMAPQKVLISGVANRHSIAWSIAQKFAKENAEIILCYENRSQLKRIQKLSEDYDFVDLIECDFRNDEQVTNLFKRLDKHWEFVDCFIHSIAFAELKAIEKPLSQCSRTHFSDALDVSVFSLIAAMNNLQGRMKEAGSVISMTYHGSTKVMPNYHVMGVAKAALESAIRYLAVEFGSQNIRVNAISAGPIKTLASSAMPYIGDKLLQAKECAPLGNNTQQSEVADLAYFLASNKSRAMTGGVHYVDHGLNILGA